MPFAHTLISLKSLERGINKLVINKKEILNDLNQNWAVVAEAIQTILRREGYPNPYEALKQLTRKNTNIDEKCIQDFIENLNIDPKVKEELKKISPLNYTGI